VNLKNDMFNKIHNQLNNNIIKVVISVYYNDYVYNFDLAWIDQDSQEVDYSISKESNREMWRRVNNFIREVVIRDRSTPPLCQD